jgi:hypothetical protein
VIRLAAICLSLIFPFGVLHAQAGQGSPDLFTLTFAQGLSPAGIVAPASVEANRFSQNAGLSEDEIDRLFDEVSDVEQAIAVEEERNGTNSPALIEQFKSLAALHQELGNYDFANAALTQARSIIRMSAGLHTLDQAEVVDQMIESREAIGAFNESEVLQDDLLDLARRNTLDPRAPSVLASVAERQMEIVRAYIDERVWSRSRENLVATEGSGWQPSTPRAGREKAFTALESFANEFDAALEEALADESFEIGSALNLETDIPEVYELVDTANDFLEVGVLPRYEDRIPTWEPEEPRSGREFAEAALHRARRLYSLAMQSAYLQGNESEYWAYDAEFTDTHYFEQANPDLAPDLDEETRLAPLEGALRARVADRMARGAPAVEVARALLELGDALANAPALEQYQSAYDLLVKADVPKETIDELLHPAFPVIRRAYGPEDWTEFDGSHPYRGHVDVQVEIGRYGQATEVEIQSASPGTSRAIERRLRKHVNQTRFRPRFVAGSPLRSDRFLLRYFYDYDVD